MSPRHYFTGALTAAIAMSGIQLGSCHTGVQLETFRPAHNPDGIRVQIELEREQMSGELLEVRADGLLIYASARDQRIVLVPYSLIERATFNQFNRVLTSGRDPDDVTKERLRLLSRFPQGLSEELMASVLAAYGQNHLEILGP
jgi:hypothetical protein